MYLKRCLAVCRKLISYAAITILLVLSATNFLHSSAPDTKMKITDSENSVRIVVSGAVLNPGTYILNKNNTVKEAVAAAGGFLDSADTNINLDKTLSGMQNIHIFENPDPNAAPLININTASKEDLSTLPGIGDKTAGEIINYRTLCGPFKTTEELLNVSGIGEKIFQKIKGKITV